VDSALPHDVSLLGQVFVFRSGLNDEGQLFANSKETACIAQPQLMSTLSTQRIIAVATGTSHTAVKVLAHPILSF
jgi:Regulator of chromosome condensation (RCC1) repeat